MNPGSRNRLNRSHIKRFEGDTNFHKLARAVCRSQCLPRKELYEAWEVGKRVRRRLRGGPIVDLAAGHGLLAWILLLLDNSSPEAICVDRRKPKSFDRLAEQIVARWPHLEGRVSYVESSLAVVSVQPDALLVSVHACGALTDQVLTRAIKGRHRVAVLPCCHDRDTCDTGGLEPWMELEVAIDATRMARLRTAGFDVHATTIPAEVTPMNRLIMAVPPLVRNVDKPDETST